MDTTKTRPGRKRNRVIPQVKVHPELHEELVKLAQLDGQTIQGALHFVLCERFNRLELSRRTRLTALTL